MDRQQRKRILRRRSMFRKSIDIVVWAIIVSVTWASLYLLFNGDVNTGVFGLVLCGVGAWVQLKQ